MFLYVCAYLGFDRENCQRKQNLLLTITSVLSILFMALHLADDIVLGFEKGGARCSENWTKAANPAPIASKLCVTT